MCADGYSIGVLVCRFGKWIEMWNLNFGFSLDHEILADLLICDFNAWMTYNNYQKHYKIEIINEYIKSETNCQIFILKSTENWISPVLMFDAIGNRPNIPNNALFYNQWSKTVECYLLHQWKLCNHWKYQELFALWGQFNAQKIWKIGININIKVNCVSQSAIIFIRPKIHSTDIRKFRRTIEYYWTWPECLMFMLKMIFVVVFVARCSIDDSNAIPYFMYSIFWWNGQPSK